MTLETRIFFPSVAVLGGDLRLSELGRNNCRVNSSFCSNN